MTNYMDKFPFSKVRSGQAESVNKIMDAMFSGKKFLIADMPTGSGKSAIGLTVARNFNSSYYITAQKILQDQLVRDFGENGLHITESDEHMVELKGRNAYPCNYYKRISSDDTELKKIITQERKDRLLEMAELDISCAQGECKRDGKGKLKYCEGYCPYFNQLNNAVNAKITLMNFHSFLFQTQMVKDRWSRRDLLIIDEGHLTEQVLLDFVSMSLVDKALGIDLPKLNSAEEYLIHLEENNVIDIMAAKSLEALANNNDEMEDYWKKQIIKYDKFRTAITDGVEDWVIKYEKKEKTTIVEFKPLYVRKFAHEILFSIADKVLIMSATILNHRIFADSLGIERQEYEYVTLPNTFPLANRPIYYKPSGSMAFRNKAETIPKMISDIEKICNDNTNHKGIIHTHSFDICKSIMNGVSSKVRSRLLFQEDFKSKDDLLAAHDNSKNASIIIGPSYAEGLDLKDDKSRFQILCKVPYPSFVDNPQLEQRMKLSSDYYAMITAHRLIQSAGRSIRSDTDWANTYVLDADFKTFCERNRSMLPKWFLEAIVWR